VSRFTTGVSVICDIRDWRDVFEHVRTGRPLESLERRDGTRIVAPAAIQLWNHYNDIWNHRSYTKHIDIPAGGVVLDIGANVGLFSLFAARKAQLVHAFEPSTATFPYLAANTQGTPHIFVHNHAIGCADGRASLNISGPPTSYTLTDRETCDTASEVVESRTIGTVFRDLGIEHCDYMKLDCEGSEYPILLSADATLLKKIDAIVLEFHDHLSSFSHIDLLQKLASSGFSATVYNHRAPYGMIAARRGKNQAGEHI
jgi:FkbM family methyltransferase